MHFKINALIFLTASIHLVAGHPSDPVTVEGNHAIGGRLAARQTQYSCHTVASNDLGACNNAITTLRGLEANGCNVWACIGAVASSSASCAAAAEELGLNPLADVLCFASLATADSKCDGCL
ncbi:hypothetical protein BS50DRAFT_627105 [Corynespora cassiicola Philippines]|uniref:Fungal calcium binding protein domain-containing protein n=1 Tax=Corynespora cassiicola Philippines TaxID=1448308 RepID=A0A2T2N014_CORCC|nr:hypothetical protein BS50DRAFT_627105 [Corynespora cassiicola Philippines]